jgi:hypothetical protein
MEKIPIVHQHGVESPVESERPHIAVDKRAVRIQLLGLCEHDGTQIQAGDLELPLQVQDILPAPALDIQQGRSRVLGRLSNQVGDMLAVVRVLRGGIAPHRP